MQQTARRPPINAHLKKTRAGRQGRFLIGIVIGVLGGGPFAAAYIYVNSGSPEQSPTLPSLAPVPLPSIPAPAPVTAPAPLLPQAELHAPPPMVQPQPGSPERVFIPIDSVERVDCRAPGAPRWCRKISYATKGERLGTVVAVLRTKIVGEIFLCMDGRHISTAADDARVPASVLKEIGAWGLSLEPRDTRTRYEYYLLPEGSGLSEPEWMGDCPVGSGANPI